MSARLRKQFQKQNINLQQEQEVKIDEEKEEIKNDDYNNSSQINLSNNDSYISSKSSSNNNHNYNYKSDFNAQEAKKDEDDQRISENFFNNSKKKDEEKQKLEEFEAHQKRELENLQDKERLIKSKLFNELKANQEEQNNLLKSQILKEQEKKRLQQEQEERERLQKEDEKRIRLKKEEEERQIILKEQEKIKKMEEEARILREQEKRRQIEEQKRIQKLQEEMRLQKEQEEREKLLKEQKRLEKLREEQRIQKEQEEMMLKKQKLEKSLNEIKIENVKNVKEIANKLQNLNPQKEIAQQEVSFVQQYSVINEKPITKQEKEVMTKEHEKLQNKYTKEMINFPSQNQIKAEHALLLINQMLLEYGITTYFSEKQQGNLIENSKEYYQSKMLECGAFSSAFYYNANFEQNLMQNEIEKSGTLANYIANFKQSMNSKLQIEGNPQENIVVFAVSLSPPQIQFNVSPNLMAPQKAIQMANSGYFRQMGLNLQISNLLENAQITQSMFAPQFNMTWNQSIGSYENRGSLKYYTGQIKPQPYYFPIGFQGIGLNINKYGSNQKWIGKGTEEGVWIALFHGTSPFFIKNIIENNLKGGPNNIYGNKTCRITNKPINSGQGANAYLADKVELTIQYSLNKQTSKKKYAIVFQCRVNPLGVKSPINNPNYYTVENPLEDIHPYRLLIKEM